jgi:hypothetical protein
MTNSQGSITPEFVGLRSHGTSSFFKPPIQLHIIFCRHSLFDALIPNLRYAALLTEAWRLWIGTVHLDTIRACRFRHSPSTGLFIHWLDEMYSASVCFLVSLIR